MYAMHLLQVWKDPDSIHLDFGGCLVQYGKRVSALANQQLIRPEFCPQVVAEDEGLASASAMDPSKSNFVNAQMAQLADFCQRSHMVLVDHLQVSLASSQHSELSSYDH